MHLQQITLLEKYVVLFKFNTKKLEMEKISPDISMVFSPNDLCFTHMQYHILTQVTLNNLK